MHSRIRSVQSFSKELLDNVFGYRDASGRQGGRCPVGVVHRRTGNFSVRRRGGRVSIVRADLPRASAMGVEFSGEGFEVDGIHCIRVGWDGLFEVVGVGCRVEG